MMLPFRLAANIKRYQSPFLMGQYAQVVTMERDLVLRLLPAEVRGDRYRVEALCAALSFRTWRAIRQDQGLSVEDSGAVVAIMVGALIRDKALVRRQRRRPQTRARPEGRRGGKGVVSRFRSRWAQ